jgi:DUF4097 and DUF4098 domain-containing protein YvlB
MLTSSVALLLAVLAPPIQQTDTTVAIQSGARLNMELMGGSIAIDTWDQEDRIRVRAEHGSRDEIRIQTSGSVVRVRSNTRGSGIIDYQITVPAAMDLELTGLYTEIEVSGARGRVNANTVQGGITVLGGREQVELHSVNGRVVLAGAEGSVSVVSVSGGVEVQGVNGELEAETVSGPLILTDISSSDVDASSVSGPVFFDGALEANGRYTFATHSGPITVAVPPGLDATVTVALMSGSFSSTLGSFTADTGIRGRRQTFTAGTGTAILELESFSGPVRLVGRGEVAPPGGSLDPERRNLAVEYPR